MITVFHLKNNFKNVFYIIHIQYFKIFIVNTSHTIIFFTIIFIKFCINKFQDFEFQYFVIWVDEELGL
jgi:hypothetical protein